MYWANYCMFSYLCTGKEWGHPLVWINGYDKTRVKWVFGKFIQRLNLKRNKRLDRCLPQHEPSNYQITINKSGILPPADMQMLLWPNPHSYFRRIIFFILIGSIYHMVLQTHLFYQPLYEGRICLQSWKIHQLVSEHHSAVSVFCVCRKKRSK